MRLLLLLLIAVVVVGLVSGRFGRGASSRASRPGGTGPGPGPANAGGEPMVACAHCDLHLPRAEALWSDDRPFCTDAHRIAHGQRGGPK